MVIPQPNQHGRHWPLAVTVVALGACYAETLRGMSEQWLIDPDMGHGWLVPFVVAWAVWSRRSRLSELRVTPSAWGLVIILSATCLALTGALGGGLFISSLAFLMSLLGVTVAFGGWPWVRTLAFPFLLTLFMLPKLAIVYNQATLPLQLTAGKLAAGILTMSGYGVLRSGNVLEVAGHRILVAEACNGIRFLLPLAFAASVLGHLNADRPGARVLLLAAALPLAILANGLRVAIAAAVPYFLEETPHLAMGVVVFALSCGLLASFRPVLQRTGF